MREASGCDRRRQHHELVVAQANRAEPALGGREREHAEVEAALLHFDADLARRDASDVELDARVLLAEALDQRQEHVDRGLVGADEDPAALEVAQVADRRFGLFGEPHQTLRVVEEHPAGLGELAVLGRAIEEPLAEVVLETADRLADRRLRAMQARGGAREAALRGDGQKDLKLCEIHGFKGGTANAIITQRLCFRKDYKLD